MVACSVVVVLALLALGAAFETEDDVIVATDSNFDEIIASHPYTLVEFYAPWCGHCKSLAPEYAKAAALLKDTQATLVKLDATVHTKTAEKFEIRGYPTLKFFKIGEELEYTGGRTAKDIVAWMNKKSGPPATLLDSVATATALAEANEVVIFGFFNSESDKEASAFLIAAEHGEQEYGVSYNPEVAAHYQVTAPKIIILKKFDEGRADYDGVFESPEIAEFAIMHELPSVIEFSDAVAPKIFGGDIKSHLLLFANKKSEGFDAMHNAMQSVAGKHRGQLLFVVIDSSVPEHHRIIEFFSLSETELPAFRIITLGEDMSKFKPEATTITADTLEAFAADFLAGNLKKHLNSEKTPEDWDAKPVKILTGENFQSVALDPTKSVFVEFYAPWCGHCKQLAPIWDQLAELFAEHPNIVIAKMDSTVNEVEQVSVQSFPTLKFFAAGENKEPKDYNLQRDIETLAQFIMEETGVTVDLSAIDEILEGDDEGHDEL